MTRVLLIGGTLESRMLLASVIAADPDLTLAGSIATVEEALQLIRATRPDVVAMDIIPDADDWPRMVGLIMSVTPVPIVLVSAADPAAKGPQVVERARIAGALMMVRRPVHRMASDFAERSARLRSALKAMAGVGVIHHRAPPARLGPAPRRALVWPRRMIVGVAASTGGLSAMIALLSELPASYDVPILVVQHLGSMPAETYAGLLADACSLTVKVAVHGERLQPGVVFIAPNDRHLGVSGWTVELSLESPINGFRPAASFLFASVARAFGAAACGIVLTGMGEDGLAGVETLRAHGGTVIAQDERSSAVFGMPGAVITAGLADLVLPPRNIGRELARHDQ